MTKEFAKRLRREIYLYLREMRDGCVECRVRKTYCPEHNKIAHDLVLHPRKYLDLKSVK